MDQVAFIIFGIWMAGCLKYGYDTMRLRQVYIAANIDPDFQELARKARYNPVKQIAYAKKSQNIIFINNSGFPEVDALARRARRDYFCMMILFTAILMCFLTGFSVVTKHFTSV